MNTLPITAVAAGLACLAGTTASAQAARSVVAVGDVAAGDGVVSTVTRLDEFNVNQLGGYAVLSGDAAQRFIVGGINPLLPATVLAGQGARGGFTITNFVSAPDIADDGTVAFRAATSNSAASSAVFRGNTAVAVRNSPLQPSAGFAGGTYNIPNRVQLSADGSGTSFTSSINGFGSASALFTNDGANAPLKFVFAPSGQNQSTVVSGTPIRAALGSSSYEVSSDGTRFISEFVGTGLPTNDGAIAVGVVGGAVTVPTVNGSPIREDSPIAAGSADRWDDFDRFGIANDGTYLFTGSLQDAAGNATDEFLAINGNIVLRTGDSVGGTGGGVIDGNFFTAELNNTGDYATITTIGGKQSLLFNGSVLLDLDSVSAVGATLGTFASFETGVDKLGLTDSLGGTPATVFFEGTTSAGTKALFTAVVPEPASAALLAAGGLLLARRRRVA